MSNLTPDQAIETLVQGQAALDALLARLSDEEMARPATIGGGDWSASDLLGHIAFWEELAADLIVAHRIGARPAVDAISAAGDAGVDTANAENQARTRRQSLQEVRAYAADAHAALVARIRSLSEKEWRAACPEPSGRTRTLAERLGRVLGGERRGLFGHAYDHLPDLQAYAHSCGHR